MKMITFTDYDGVSVSIPMGRVLMVRKPSGLVHDHGSLTLISGTSISFNAESTATRIIHEMMEETE